MSFDVVRNLPKLSQIVKDFPLSSEMLQIKAHKDYELKNILEGKIDKLIVVIGPCSADNEESVCEYINKLSIINEEVKEKLFLICRVYTTKPRTLGGYKGMLYQPYVSQGEDENILEGLKSVRKLYVRAFSESKMPMADEMLYPNNLEIAGDVLSYIAVGARSVENQEHRLVASGFDCPVGMKNPINGSITSMINAITVSQKRNRIIYDGNEVVTSGNRYSHGILRGYVDDQNNNIQNYSYDNILKVMEYYNQTDNKNKTLIIDTNHSNSGKQFDKQSEIVKKVLNYRKSDYDVSKFVKGFMIESYLKDGNQEISNNMIYGKSITDPCIGLEKTRELLLNMANLV